MDLQRFITFKMVVEKGSSLCASQKPCCTQSTVTSRIQQLEQELVTPLFKRIGRRMCPIATGKNVSPHVYDLTKVMASICRVVRRDNELGGELRVATGEILLAYKMPLVLQCSRQRAPKVHLSLQSLDYYSIRDALFADGVDLGMFYRVSNDDAFIMMGLSPQLLALVASIDQAPIDFLRPRQYIPSSFTISEPQCMFRQIFESILHQRGIIMESTIEPWSIESIRQCVADNLGVSFLPCFAVEEELKRRTLAELPFSETPLAIHTLYAHHARKAVSPAMRVFMQCMQEEQETR